MEDVHPFSGTIRELFPGCQIVEDNGFRVCILKKSDDVFTPYAVLLNGRVILYVTVYSGKEYYYLINPCN